MDAEGMAVQQYEAKTLSFSYPELSDVEERSVR